MSNGHDKNGLKDLPVSWRVFSIWSSVLMRNCVDTLEEKSCVDLDREFLDYMLGPNYLAVINV